MSTYEIRCSRAGDRQFEPSIRVVGGLSYKETQRRMEELLALTDLTLHFQGDASK